MPTEGVATTLTEMAAELRDQDSEKATIDTMLDQATSLLPHAVHVSITVRKKRGRYHSAGSTSELAQTADLLQYELDEGPCVEAAAPDGAGWFRSGDITTDPRWSRWGPAAGALGAASLISVQLFAEGQSFGAVNMYSEEPGDFVDPSDVDLAILWATHAAAALRAVHKLDSLATAMQSRHTIGAAQGILMEKYGLTLDQSFQLLNRIASSSQTKVRDVARQVVEARELPA